MAEQITATIIGFGPPYSECYAMHEGRKIAVDPFVTGAWDWENRSNLLGTWQMRGRWYNEDCFLPDTFLNQTNLKIMKNKKHPKPRVSGLAMILIAIAGLIIVAALCIYFQ
ncbi:hypothetical protein I2I11_04025 [Pontibacter sp. 172403-2]|uniref:hypothetical protein n=1 Tax=Pontibacter rufus TaxID=2791028 RepID=UPI0018AF9270|nr:hypothetical protein [Pontibacter sp. 172403-2]MBF9252451.1 hypothetical protein [Pontibacter sp. 172403-2]